jgi:hypothetical protein
MKLTTPVTIPPAPFSASWTDAVLAVGSCFAENIGGRLSRLRIDCLTNPGGIVYNPASVGHELERLLDDTACSEGDLVESNGLWCSLGHHGQFSRREKADAITVIEAAAEKGRTQLARSNLLLLTFGTAYAYRLKSSGRVVANCHRLPADSFDRVLLDWQKFEPSFSRLLERLKAERPDLQVVVTVSPVRHLRDSAAGNQISKAQLILLCDALVRRHDFVVYFPAYEIMMDELRDYRFYGRDLVHPSNLAIDIIWERFRDWCWDDEALEFFAAMRKLNGRDAHRPNSDSPAGDAFQAETENLRAELQALYPGAFEND